MKGNLHVTIIFQNCMPLAYIVFKTKKKKKKNQETYLLGRCLIQEIITEKNKQKFKLK